jgi:Concanavalin A-like lectin/glucanases superfamily
MKMSARLLTLALIVVPAVPAVAATTMTGGTTGTATARTAAPAAVTVTRYTFDAGATAAGGRIAENSGHGTPLTVRSADRGAIRFIAGHTGRFVLFPARCVAGSNTCPRVLLEAANDADLNPGTRNFRWGATIAVGQAQVAGSSNIMQKGVTTTDSAWKLQIGANHGKAQCVLVGRGSATSYVARSSVPVTDGAWHQILCQRYGTRLIVYVDSVNRGQATIPASLSVSNTLPLRIGGPNFNTTSDMYHGALDNVYAVLG